MSIDIDRIDHVAVITINRPEARNALDPVHNAALGTAVADFEADPNLYVAVLTGAGNVAFSAGADLKTLLPEYQSKVRAGESPMWNFGGFTTLERAKPIIAAINGHALAGGCEMALACDIRLASPNATIGLAETKWAIIPGAGGTVRLPQAVPLGIAMEMILTGDPIDAAEALRIGLVNRILPSETLLSEALALAQAIASRGPLAVKAARASILESRSLTERAAMENEFKHFLEVVRTDDAAEGFAAFGEKRNPVYQGK
ncbi:enoyl-CoA hydratase-related protein [Rhodococcus erythropolis]|nr:enoyl-CoA hydratase-related protein [Rhodococcus erythropolis]